MIEKLGIAEALKPEFQLKTSGEGVAQAVARGEAEPGRRAGHRNHSGRRRRSPWSLPEVQDYVVLIGGIGAGARNGGAARELLAFVTAPAADAGVKRTGMERN